MPGASNQKQNKTKNTHIGCLERNAIYINIKYFTEMFGGNWENELRNMFTHGSLVCCRLLFMPTTPFCLLQRKQICRADMWVGVWSQWMLWTAHSKALMKWLWVKTPLYLCDWSYRASKHSSLQNMNTWGDWFMAKPSAFLPASG